MRKRPLCFLCVALVVLNFVFIASGGQTESPDVFSFSDESGDLYVTLYGEIYQCEYSNERQILYLKQTVLSAISTNFEEVNKDTEDDITVNSNGEKNESFGVENYIKLSRIRIFSKQGEEKYRIGDLVSVTGKMKSIEPASNPGQFDSQAYYAGKKISYTMWEPEIVVVGRPEFHFQRALYEIRSYFSGIIAQCISCKTVRSTLDTGCPEGIPCKTVRSTLDTECPEGIGDEAENYTQAKQQNKEKIEKNNTANLEKSELGNIMRGIVLGDKRDISQDTKNLYQTGGISHILAISAMHLTILGNGLYGMLKRFGIPISAAGIIAGVFLAVYGILTGASVATIRALIMFLLNIGAQLTGRTYDGKTSLSLAAVLLLSGNPLFLTDSGFLLSFSAMLSFAVFKENRQLGSSILLYFFMAPVVLWLFYEIPLYSVFVNLLVVPTLAVVLVSGVVTCIVGSASLFLGKLTAIPGTILLYLYELLCKLAERLPFAKVVLGKPSILGIIAYYGIMMVTLWLFRKYRLSWKRFFLYLLMIPAVFLLIYHPQTKLTIASLDVGQGDCLVIETPQNHAYMMDGGSSSVNEVGNYRIWSYLKYQGISRLKAVFVTHPDGDHISGILELLQMIRDRKISLHIDQIILPKWENISPFDEIRELAEAAGIPIVQMEMGDCLVDGEVRLSCIYPSGENFSERLNEGSLVLHVSYRDFDALLTGDLEGQGEEDVVKYLKDTACLEDNVEGLTDIEYLKVAHHGSGNSTFAEFLDLTKPDISIISCGKNNIYGHPHKDLLERLQAVDADIYATKDCGAIWITTDGEKIDLHTFKGYNTSEMTVEN